VIIEACTDELLVLQCESERPDQVQLAAGVCTQTDDIASVGRDFGLVQNYMEHKYSLSLVSK
jgi:hypothetical protein